MGATSTLLGRVRDRCAWSHFNRPDRTLFLSGNGGNKPGRTRQARPFQGRIVAGAGLGPESCSRCRASGAQRRRQVQAQQRQAAGMFHRRQAGGEHARHQVGQAGGDQAVELARAGELGQRRGRAGVRLAARRPAPAPAGRRRAGPGSGPGPPPGAGSGRHCRWPPRALAPGRGGRSAPAGKRDAAPGWTGGRGGRRRRRSAREKAALSSAASSAARCGVLHQTTEWASGVRMGQQGQRPRT